MKLKMHLRLSLVRKGYLKQSSVAEAKGDHAVRYQMKPS
jgi:hypothetical protein